MKKRILSIFLIALVLMLSIPIASLAEGENIIIAQDLKVGDKISTINTSIVSKGNGDYAHFYVYKNDMDLGISLFTSNTIRSVASLDYINEKYGYSELYFDGLVGSSFKFHAIDKNRPDCTHSFCEAWAYNSSGHWHPCSQKECTVATSKISEHTDDGFAFSKHDTNGPYGTCSVCGYISGSRKMYDNNIVVKADGIYVDNVKTNLDEYNIYFEPASGNNNAKLIFVNSCIIVTSGTKVTNPIITSLIDLDIVTLYSSQLSGDFEEDAEDIGLDAAPCIDAGGHKLKICGTGTISIQAPSGQWSNGENPGHGNIGIKADSIIIDVGKYNDAFVIDSTLSVKGGITLDGTNKNNGLAFSCEPTIVGDYNYLAASKDSTGSLPEQEIGTKLSEFVAIYIKGLVSKKHIHSNSESWTSYGANGHYHACTIDGCTVTDFSSHTNDGFAYSNHIFDKNNICTLCGFDNSTPEPEPDPINYKVIEGANSTWVIEDGENPAFRSNADFSKFVRVELDGKVLDPANYTAKSGSTIITLKPEFAAKLAPGKHTINIVSSDGSASTVFYIEEVIANTDGFTLSEATMSSAFVGIGIVGLSVVFFELKKKKVR